MQIQRIRLTVFLAAMSFAAAVFADEDPRHARHELMEGVRDAAKPVGQMLQGEREFDADTVMASLGVFKDAAAMLGDLFPAGTETGEGTKAAPAIWEDRDGFEAAIATWQKAIDGAIAASPASGEELGPAAGPVFKACKNCHDNYRIEDE
jgi:cytochrome c556